MSKAGSAAKVKLSSYDDLFGNAEEKTGSEEQIIRAKLTDLHEFRNHPFRVLDDEKMEETTESISKYGVLVPGIARPRAEGGYEIIAGHRRKRGSERAGKEDMPVIVRNYTDDEATIIMVDSNIQREDILPSEKAKAYAMKYEAMKHQGRKGNGNTLDEVGEAAGESGKTVQRYIWLARLSDELLELVDRKKIGLVQGVDISFLSEDAQQWVLVILEESGANISTVQSAKLKEYGKSGELTLPMVRLILTEEKPKEVVKSRLMKLDSSHIQYILECLKENSTQIRNIKQYLLATLYNAPVTVDSYYSAQVRREFGWGGRVDKN